MVGTLAGNENFTVFAPNDDAFAKIREAFEELMNPDKTFELRTVLLRHVVPRILMSGDIEKGDNNLKTAGNEEITVNKQAEVTITASDGRTATVIQFDVQASNGVIHIVDSVL